MEHLTRVLPTEKFAIQSYTAALDNLRLQVVDLPPVTANTMDALPYGRKLAALLSVADVVCVVLDLSQDVESQEQTIAEDLGSFGVDDQEAAPLVLGNRALASDGEDIGTVSGALSGPRHILRSDEDFREVLPQIARAGGYISAFTKPPGQSVEEADRLWVERGATVQELAAAVHRDLARRLAGARVWREPSTQLGQTVSTDHVLCDRDVVELHMR